MTRKELEDAVALVNRHVLPTPQLRWPLLCEALGAEIWIKHENHTPTGAFKVRGGITYMSRLMQRLGSADEVRLITATRGNHGQSIPFAARLYANVSVTVLVPRGNSAEKNAAMRGWGANVEEFGSDFDVAREEAERRAEKGEGMLVASYHQDLIVGVATYGLELMQAVPDLDLIYCPIGMGSGISSLVAVRDLLDHPAHIVGVVSENADAMATTFESGQLTTTETANTFADGVATRVPNGAAVDTIRRGVERIVRVSDDEVAAAIRILYKCTHNVAEGAGAAAFAAAFQERQHLRDKKIAAILTGGNIDLPWLQAVLRGETPKLTL